MSKKMFFMALITGIASGCLVGFFVLMMKKNISIPFPINAIKEIYLPNAELLTLNYDDRNYDNHGVIIKFICKKTFFGDKYWAIYDIKSEKDIDVKPNK